MASQCSGNRNKSRTFVYKSHKMGEYYLKCVCLVYDINIDVSKNVLLTDISSQYLK